jgi:hypothetical protein
VSDVTSHLVKEWLADEHVLCYRFSNLNTATVDEWVDDIVQELNAWSDEKPWRLILDIRLHGNVVNTYALRRARDISRMRPELPGRLAVLVSSHLAANVASMAIRSVNNSFRKRQVFISEPLAIHWLLDEKAK